MNKIIYQHWFSTLLTTASISIFSQFCGAQPLFQDVSEQVGLAWTVGDPYEILSVNWTDFNSDGFPDLWTMPHGPHWNRVDGPQLFINQSGAKFVNVIDSVWPEQKKRDQHGSVWGDFDNDGDQDVFLNQGGYGGMRPVSSRTLLVNEGGILIDKAAQFGLSPLPGRGRSALWLDWNKDGLLDLAHFTKQITKQGQAKQPSQLFAQTDTGFVDVSTEAGFNFDPEGINLKYSARFGVITDLFGDNIPDIMVFSGTANSPSFLVRVYRNETSILEDITDAFPKISRGRDVVVADFNQDAIPDIFIVQGRTFTKTMLVHEEDKTYILGYFRPKSDEKHGMSFKNVGNVTFDCLSEPSSIFIGLGKEYPENQFFTLSPTDSYVEGLAPLSDPGTYIGYDSATETWTVFVVGVSQEIDITSEHDFSEVTPINFTPIDIENSPQHAMFPIYWEYDSTLDQYIDKTAEAGFSRRLLGFSVVSGDFDNDMDQDIYIRQVVSNVAPGQSVYYENQGDGTFLEIADAKGATVPILRAGLTRPYGNGPLIAVADYDLNGFLDIFTAAQVRQSHKYNKNFHVGVPTRLFQNQGNNNHWLQIDLEGTISNRDAIGAKVLIYTPDGKVQVRMQDGGHRIGAQNQHRLHFGLGSNTTIDTIEVIWPTGDIQTIKNVAAADQILHILEKDCRAVRADYREVLEAFQDVKGLVPRHVQKILQVSKRACRRVREAMCNDNSYGANFVDIAECDSVFVEKDENADIIEIYFTDENGIECVVIINRNENGDIEDLSYACLAKQ